jgi:hypothetical protein
MKLSEAIREGAKLGPQAFGEYFVGDATCALGAAKRATNTAHDEELFIAVGLAYVPVVEVPMCLHGEYRRTSVNKDQPKSFDEITSLMIKLNDKARWSREAIADWLESEGY